MVRSSYPRVLLFGLATCLAGSHVECATAPEPGDLHAAGKVEFPISCAPSVQSEFSRGVALLHSFFYEQARRVFTSVAERDPKCAMAQWGIAMTWWHPIWTPPTPVEMSAGKAAIEKPIASEDSSRHSMFITIRRTIVRAQARLGNRVMVRWDRATVSLPTKKQCISFATSIRTISKPRRSTLSRSWL